MSSVVYLEATSPPSFFDSKQTIQHILSLSLEIGRFYLMHPTT